MTSVENI